MEKGLTPCPRSRKLVRSHQAGRGQERYSQCQDCVSRVLDTGDQLPKAGFLMAQVLERVKTLTPPFFLSTYIEPLEEVGYFQLMEGLPSGKWSPALGFLVGLEDELEVLSGGRKHLTE